MGEFTKEDLTGTRFDSLVVTEFDHRDVATRRNFWKCQCDCGKEVVVGGNFLKNGFATNCGCGIKYEECVERKPEIENGTKVKFDPFANIRGTGFEDYSGKFVIGTVDYINRPHRWFSVKYDGGRISFNFCDIGSVVTVCG